MTRALFIDRDGTINVDHGYVYRAEDFEFIDGVFDFLAKVQRSGYLIIVVTNQSGVARGYYDEAAMERCNDHMVAEFAKRGIVVADVLCCTALDENDPDRKPNPGLFLKARDRHAIDMAGSISLGDKPRDVEAGKRAGVGRNFLFEGRYPEEAIFEEGAK